jgi:hypothetical protein
MTTFQARHKTVCDSCGDDIHPGDPITGVTGVGFVHEGCVEDASKAPQMGTPRQRAVDLTVTTMPRGKTARDRCDDCFMVHSPGQDGCYG